MQTRVRSNPEIKTVDPIAELNTDIAELFALHTAQKRADSAYKKAREALHKQMLAKGLKSHIAEIGEGEAKIRLSATVEKGTVVGIDIDKLETHVKFKEIRPFLSITKTAVKDKWGNEIAEDCTVLYEGSENVTVKPV